MSEIVTNTFSYTGSKALENMNEAVNYNHAILGLIEKTSSYTAESKILDFGAGVGTFSKLMRARGLKIDCLEIDAEEAAYLTQDGFTVYEDLKNVADGAYDLIYSLNVLEHIEDHVGVLSELHKKLKPGGTLFLYVPAFPSLYTEFDAMLGHFRRYKKEDLTSVLKESGYTILDMRYYDTLGFFAAQAFKFLRFKPEHVTKTKIWIFDRIIFPFNVMVDPLFRRWFGKNIYAVCTRKSNTNE